MPMKAVLVCSQYIGALLDPKRASSAQQIPEKYHWSYCYGAIDVVNGELLCIQTPSTNLQWTEAFLKEI